METTVKAMRDRKRSGSSLIEALCALFVFAGGIGGSCHLALTANMVSDQARAHYQAINIAKNRLERARVLGFEQLDRCGESLVRVNESGVPDGSGNFRRTTTVVSLGNDLKELQVRVEMRDRKTLLFGGEAQEISSIIAKFRTEVGS